MSSSTATTNAAAPTAEAAPTATPSADNAPAAKACPPPRRRAAALRRDVPFAFALQAASDTNAAANAPAPATAAPATQPATPAVDAPKKPTGKLTLHATEVRPSPRRALVRRRPVRQTPRALVWQATKPDEGTKDSGSPEASRALACAPPAPLRSTRRAATPGCLASHRAVHSAHLLPGSEAGRGQDGERLRAQRRAGDRAGGLPPARCASLPACRWHCLAPLHCRRG